MSFKTAEQTSEYQRKYRLIHKLEKAEHDKQYYLYRKSGGIKLGHHKKASDNELLDSYNRLGSVWNVAEEFGMAGQNVWERLKKLGIVDNDKWNNEQLNILRQAYSGSNNEPLNIKELSIRLGRIKSNVCRKARELGLTTNRKRNRSSEMSKAIGDRTKTWIRIHGHLRGYRELRLCPICGKMKDVPHCSTAKTCSRSCAAILRMRSEHQFSRCSFGRRIDLDNRFFRSAYEANYARYLNYCIANSLFNIVSWQYEPDTFKFTKVTDTPKQYTPDFKVFYNEYHCEYHEVKGWDYPKGIIARQRFNKYYPKLKLKLVSEDFFDNAVKGDLASLIPNWEYYKIKKVGG